MKSNDFDLLTPGDLLVRSKGLFTHYGIYLPNGKVLHNAPFKGEHASSLAEFGNGEKITIYKPRSTIRQYILANASVVLRDPKEYNALVNNCEHTVTRVITGTAYSQQLMFGIAALVLLVITYLTIKAK